MKKTLMILSLALFSGMVCRAENSGKLENDAIVWQWNLSSNRLSSTLENKADGSHLNIDSECFSVVLGDGRTVKASDFKPAGVLRTDKLAADPASPTAARHFPGRQLTLELSDTNDHLMAVWQANLRNGSAYLQQQLTLRASGGDVLIREISLFDQPVAGAKTVGVVDGSPVVAGTFFCGYEHPMAQNTVTGHQEVQCRLTRNAVLKDGETLVHSFVLGATAPGQMRRGFQAYLERERAHPYRPFLHYNSWFDIAWDKRKYNEAESLDAMGYFARELVQKRGVQLKSFLFDDGWDDNRTLWKFHSGFPDGFAGVEAAAAKLDASVGVWISPFGGYDLARQLRLEYGVKQGFETNASGFSLAGPKYFQRFHDICLEMVKKYDVNMFKFDGLAAGAKASEAGLTRDGDAMLRLVADLRAAKPDIYINETTGTWPSPFWLLYVDSTWRGGADHDFCGKGSPRQQWITYRDAQTYENVVRRGPLYPLNSLMLHGIVYARNASKLETADDADFTDEVRSFFASGTQLQELYLTPKLLDQRNWDDIAQAANWARVNADVLVDTHWVGGDPGKGQVYGWASWTPRKAVLTLRNPDDKPAMFEVDARAVFELPAEVNGTIKLVGAFKNKTDVQSLKLRPGEPCRLTLQPLQVVVLEGGPDSILSQNSTESPVIVK